MQPSDLSMAQANSLGSKTTTQKTTTHKPTPKPVPAADEDDSGEDTLADDLARGMAGALAVPDQGGDYSGWEVNLVAPRVIKQQTETRGVTEAKLLGKPVKLAAADTPWSECTFTRTGSGLGQIGLGTLLLETGHALNL